MEILSIVVEFSTFLMEPVSIAEAIKKSVEKLGIEHLKDKQREAITAFMEGKGVFVSLLAMENHSLHYCHMPLIQ